MIFSIQHPAALPNALRRPRRSRAPSISGASGPGENARRKSRRGQARLIVAVALVYALLAPVYGPLLSPAFIELLPNHAHVHAGGQTTFHLHTYETPPDAPEDGSGVFAIPPANDGSFAGGAGPVALAALLLLAAAPVLTRIARRRPARLVGVTLETDTPPPKRALLHA